MLTVTTRAGEVAYNVKGEGQPIIMLHATLHDSRDYDNIAESLAKSYRTIAVDLPWHGDSIGVSNHESLSATGFADVLEDVVGGLRLAPAILIGNSVGGFAAARLAITRPDWVRALVLVNTGGFVVWTPFRRVVARILGLAPVSRIIMPYLVRKYMSPQTTLDEEITSRVAARAGTVEGSVVAARLWRSFPDKGHDLRSRAESIKCPVLLIWGTRDPVCPKAVGEAAKKMIPGSRLELMDSGHVVFSSKPKKLEHVLRQFLSSSLDETFNALQVESGTVSSTPRA